MKNWEKVCKITDLEDGVFSIFDVAKFSIGVLKLNSNFYAILNYCPHAGAELCKGKLRQKTVYSDKHGVEYSRNEKVLSCPWHGWEFNIKNGATDFGVRSKPARVFSTKIMNDHIYINV